MEEEGVVVPWCPGGGPGWELWGHGCSLAPRPTRARVVAEGEVGAHLYPVVNILHGDGSIYDPLIWRITG